MNPVSLHTRIHTPTLSLKQRWLIAGTVLATAALLANPAMAQALEPVTRAGTIIRDTVVGLALVILTAAWGAGLVSIWIAPVMATVLVPLYAWMRYVTYRDDQRLLQMILRMKLLIGNPNRRLWKARSYTPHLMRRSP